MSSKIFNSTNGLFSLRLPLDWEQAEENDPNSYAFLNGKDTTGILRISHFRWRDLETAPDMASRLIEDELAENKNSIPQKLGNYNSAYYNSELVEDGHRFGIHFWTTGEKSDVFKCSFTTFGELSKENEKDLEVVRQILESIEILNRP